MSFFDTLFGGRVTLDETARLARLATANEFINLKDIRGNIGYGRDGLVYAYLRIQPFSLDALSPKEREKKKSTFAAEFSSEKKPFKFHSSSRPVDISGMAAELSELLAEAIERAQIDLLKCEIREISDIAINADVTERQCYMILWEKSGVEGERELMKRAQENKNRFASCEMNAEICGQTDIIRFLNTFANPNYAHIENDDIQPIIPFLSSKDNL